jgi:YVTN family beta-propeller protein
MDGRSPVPVRPLLLVVALVALIAPVLVPAAARAAGGPPAVPSEGHLLVLNKDDGTLMVFDLPSTTLLATIKVGREPHEVVATPDGRKAYVACVGDRGVTVVDLRNDAVLRTLRPDHLDRPHGLAMTPDGRWLLVTSEGSHRIFLFDARRDAVQTVVTTTQEGAHMVVLTADGHHAWVANRDSDSLSEYDVGSLRLVRTVKVGPGPEGIGISPNGRWVVAALQRAGQVALVDAGRGQTITRLPAGQVPIRVAFPPRSPLALVSNRASHDVTFLDLAARQVLATVPVGQSPGGVVTNAAGTRAYVCNNGSNTVSILDIGSRAVAGTLKTGANPDGIWFVPAPVAHPAHKKAGTR